MRKILQRDIGTGLLTVLHVLVVQVQLMIPPAGQAQHDFLTIGVERKDPDIVPDVAVGHRDGSAANNVVEYPSAVGDESLDLVGAVGLSNRDTNHFILIRHQGLSRFERLWLPETWQQEGLFLWLLLAIDYLLL